MINSITGRITKIAPDYAYILLPSGVEYRVEISSNASAVFSSMPDKENARILCYLQHREDAMTLFGFSSEEERFCFEQLQTVPGIGARQALRILSGITVQNLIKSLDAQDVKTLAKVPGIGPKTAQKLVLQLRNVLVLEDDEAEPKAEAPSQFRDLIDSLAEMGFERKQIVRTLSEVMSENSLIIQGKDAREAESFLFPLVLRRLSR